LSTPGHEVKNVTTTARARPILGIDLGGTQVRAGKVRGGVIERNAVARISGRERAEVVNGELYRTIDAVFDDEVTGIGCGVPSVVDVATGVVYAVENIPSWREVPLKADLERRYGVPAYVNNDANAFAVGELHFGAGRGYRNLVGLTIGTGLGAGVIVDGRLYSGAHCAAGELGAIPYRERTLEDYCAGAFFQHRAGMPGEEVYARAQNGEPAAVALFEEFGSEVGFAVLLVLHAYDPELIVLGGSISVALPLFEARMRERLRQYPWPHVVDGLRIVAAEVQDAGILGAAALYLDALDGGAGAAR